MVLTELRIGGGSQYFQNLKLMPQKLNSLIIVWITELH